MKCCFIGVFYFGGPVRHLFTIFHIYKKIATVFETVGIECSYFSKQNEILPHDKTLTEEEFNKKLPEFDLVFIWNGGLGPEIEIAEKCKKQGTPVYFMELGWLPQANTFYFDTKGVNYASTLTDWDFNTLTEEEKRIGRTKLAFYHQEVARFTNYKPTHNFVFVPLQVEGDSQIKKYSPKIKKMQQLIDFVVAYVPGKIIFKKHPKDNPGQLTFPSRCELVQTGTTHDFLQYCQYVVTINSTVGVEALSYYKPVITLGQAFYGGRGLTYNAVTGTDFEKAIEWATSNKIARGRIETFLYYLFQRQWHLSELDNPEKVLSLINNLT